MSFAHSAQTSGNWRSQTLQRRLGRIDSMHFSNLSALPPNAKHGPLNHGSEAIFAATSVATLGNEIVLFGGESPAGDLNDTWTFDGSNWTQLSVSNPPPARVGATMATLP